LKVSSAVLFAMQVEKSKVSLIWARFGGLLFGLVIPTIFLSPKGKLVSGTKRPTSRSKAYFISGRANR
jgi:hypothetical protein